MWLLFACLLSEQLQCVQIVCGQIDRWQVSANGVLPFLCRQEVDNRRAFVVLRHPAKPELRELLALVVSANLHPVAIFLGHGRLVSEDV